MTEPAVSVSATLSRLGTAAATFVAAPKKMLIDGRRVAARCGGTIDVVDPATGKVFNCIPAGQAADVDLAVAAARRAFDEGPWARMSPADRARLMWRLGDLIEAHADELAEIESLDNGKPVTDARTGDVPGAAALLRYMAGWCTKITGQTIPLSAAQPFHAYTLREPVGVCGQIIPWNFPLMMAAWKLGPALASGCTVVLKPAEQTSLSALRLADLIEEADFPPGVVNVITGLGETAGAALAAHPDVDKVAFTGSTEVGRKILAAACGNLKKVSLELGGKSPMIVFDDADIEGAVKAVASGVFYNMGQTCTAGTRLYVHERVAREVLEGVAAEARALRIGHGLDPRTQIGPLVSEEQFNKVRGYVSIGLEEGARLVTGGAQHGHVGYFFEPTLLADTTPDMRVVREEIFGPVLAAASFADEEAVVREANNSIYGLAGSLFTRDLSRAHRVVKRLKAGTIGINTHHVIDAALPFGGFRQSGWGREMGWEAIQLYTDVKSVGIAL